ITATQIDDESKGNIISKGLIILHVVFSLFQLISRAAYHISTTLLETLALHS
ncbi:hypothetical protein K503DRAFT_703284, partial [Rhizopogon vinicolor AM-OR11-026]